MGKQHNNPYRVKEPHYFERTSNGRRAMRNMVRRRNVKATGHYSGLTDRQRIERMAVDPGLAFILAHTPKGTPVFVVEVDNGKA